MNEPKRLGDGRYYANVGYLTVGSRNQPKFVLGRDRAEAIIRAALIEKLWGRSVEIARVVSGESPAWDEVALAIAKRIAAGDKTVNVDHRALADSPQPAVELLSGWQSVVPGIKLLLRDQTVQQRGTELIRKEARFHLDYGRSLLEEGGSQTLSEAITAYVAAIKANPCYLIVDRSRLTDWGWGKIGLIEFDRDHMPNVLLSEMTMRQISELLDILAARPCKKTPAGVQTDTPISRNYARTAIKEFRQFLNWLHESEDFFWEKPRDYAVKPIRVRKDTRRKGPVRVQTYDLSELVVLWQYATPWERCLMVLALNTAFGMAEVATLARDEVLLRSRHPHADEFRVTSDDRDSWIVRLRQKTDVYGEWKLWGETVRAVEWLFRHRPKSDTSCVVLTKSGTPLKVEGKRNVQIANAWTRLLGRVRRDHSTFRKLSFNKLRKTVANFVRREDGEVIAELMLSHGEPFGGDISAYTNERWADLHSALSKLRQWLAPVFAAVTDPFPDHEKLGGANISRATIDRIIELHAAGDRISLIAEKLSLTTGTVRRWVSRKQAEPARDGGPITSANASSVATKTESEIPVGSTAQIDVA